MADNDAIIAEFQGELDDLATRCEGKPDREVRRLWQIALERESLVTVAYRRDIIGSRLRRMPIGDAERRVVSRAIRWVWRDEEMHALWMRGILLREGNRRERLRAWSWSLEGRVAGWTTSRQAHYRWREAPVRRAVAEVLEVGGRLAGRIPETITGQIHFQSFADYCRFNVAAEKTAELAWLRMVELAKDPDARVSTEDAQAFVRIAEDEGRHGQLFSWLADCFADDDTLLPHVDVATLEQGLARIGQRFPSSPTPGDAAWHNPLGKGAPVVIREANTVTQALHEALDTVDFSPTPGSTVAIKTTFMFGVDRADRSPLVSIPLLHALVRRFKDQGATVVVIDSRNIYDRFHAHRSVEEVAAYFEIHNSDFELCDAQDDQTPHRYLRGFGPGTACTTWRDADHRILLGKLRSHPSDSAMLSLHCAEGLGGRHDAFTFSDRKADRHTAILALLDAMPPELAILDAFDEVPDGLTGMMGCTHPLQPQRVYASTDAVSLDVVVARHLGVEPDTTLLGAAFDWFGDPQSEMTINGVDAPIAGWKGPGATPATSVLAALSLPIWDHASSRGALFLPTFDTEAFPPVTSVHPVFARARDVARRIVDTGGRPHAVETLLPTEVVRIDGRAVRLHRHGDGPVVVLLHGYPENLQLFSRLARLLRGFEVVAFDWPGQGYSDAPAASVSPTAMSHELLRILDHLGHDQVHLVATDMGVHPALVTAAVAPHRVKRVVAMNALLFGDAATSWEIAVMRRSGLNRTAFRLTPGIVWSRCMATFMDDTLPEAHQQDMWTAFRRRVVREHLIAMCDAAEHALPTLPEFYWQIRCPVLALWGEADPHFPPQQAQRLAALLPEARVETLPDAAHWMVWSHAGEIAHHVQGFLDEEAP